MTTVIRFNFMDRVDNISQALLLLKDTDLKLYIDGEEKQIVGQLDIAAFDDSLPDWKPEEPESSQDSGTDPEQVPGG